MSIPLHTQTTKTVKILIVEDEYILGINLQETLESLKYTVVGLADSAAAAISQAKELRPNIILMDIRLRGEQDGIQAAELIWNRLQIPVIYVTGHSDNYTVERATLTSPFGYILKPIKEQELYVAIQTALNRYEREQFLSSVLRGMGDGVIVVDTQRQIKYMNQVAEAFTGWRWDEAKGQLLAEVVKLIDQETQLPAENPIIFALQQETTIYLDSLVLLIAKDGTTIPIAYSATPLRDNNGVITGAVLVFRDDTQGRLIAERELADKSARELGIQLIEMEKLNQLKEDFLANTSHEMRTPLSNMKMAICMLEHILDKPGVLQSVPPTTSWSINRYLNILRDQCEQEINLVDDLLYMRIIDADFYPLELTSIHIQDWLPHFTAAFLERVEARRETLKISVAPDLPSVFLDMSLLSRIVLELLNNADKYTPPQKEITVNAQLVITTDAQIPLWEIIVSNSGVKIPIEEQSRIFEAFYRIPQSDRWQHSGTGLGLAVVKKLVEYLQGTITVNSTPRLTSFIVQLPLKLSK